MSEPPLPAALPLDPL